MYKGNCVRADGDGEAYVPRPAGYPLTALKWPMTERVMNEGTGHIWKRYNLPIYITENGQSCNDRIFLDGAVHDSHPHRFPRVLSGRIEEVCGDG